MFGQLEYGWALALFLGWIAFRIMLTLIRGVVQGSTFGRRSGFAISGIVDMALLSGIVFALSFCLGWRWLVPRQADAMVWLLSVGGIIVGFVVGIAFDFTLTIRFEHRIGLTIAGLKRTAWLRDLQGGDAPARNRAARALSYLAARAHYALSALIDAVRNDTEVEVRRHALRALYGMASEDSQIVLAARHALRDPDPGVRATAACVLVDRKGASADEVLPLLIAGSKHDETEVANFATHHIGLLGAAGAPAIAELILQFASAERRWAACDALVGIGEPSIAALAACASEGDVETRIFAVNALCNFGAKAKAAIPVLTKALQDPDARLRSAAQSALKAVSAAPTNAK